MHRFKISSILAASLWVLTACGGSDPATPETSTPSEDTAEETRDTPSVEWALAIHGGAGVISKDMEQERKQGYFDALEQALTRGRDHLEQGGTALDAVQKVVLHLEDDERFNAGKGAVYTHEETHELDAAIMDGSTLDCGSVGAVTTVKNPILLARAVLEQSPHVFLMGQGAEVFAEEQGLELVDQEYFHTERRYESLQRALERERQEAAGEGNGTAALGDGVGEGLDTIYSTVGAVALDRNGNLAAATSTGGLTNKRFGRVGDVPVIGAGTYADNRSCAVSGTGKGEQFIRHTVARSIAARMQLGGATLEEAARAVIDGELDPGDGGVIAVSKTGEIALVFNSEGMFRGAADSSGRFEVAIWE